MVLQVSGSSHLLGSRTLKANLLKAMLVEALFIDMRDQLD